MLVFKNLILFFIVPLLFISVPSLTQAQNQEQRRVKKIVDDHINYVSNYYIQKLKQAINTKNLTKNSPTNSPKKNIYLGEEALATYGFKWEKYMTKRKKKLIKKIVVWKYRVSSLMLGQCCTGKKK